MMNTSSSSVIRRAFYIIIYSALLIVPIVSLVKYLWVTRPCSEPLQYDVVIKKILPRSSDTFTQGLFVFDNHFYESFGQYGFSGRKIYKIGEMTPKRLNYNSDNEFAEGMTRIGDKTVQITWKDEIAYILDDDLITKGSYKYKGEGWGLTHDGSSFIMSDGSDQITFRSLENFEEIRHIEVRELDKVIKNLNELEYIKGEIFANIWMSDDIVAIDPQRGCVTRRINASGLWDHEDRSKLRSGGVLNGIAYHSELGHIYLTGKYWDHIYQVELKKID